MLRKAETAAAEGILNGRKCVQIRLEGISSKDNIDREPLRVYDELRRDGVRPSISTVLAALKLCTSMMDIRNGSRIHAHVVENGDNTHIFVANTLVNMYSKCGDMVEARRIFDEMVQRSVVSWNAIVLGYAESGKGELALEMYAIMQQNGCRPDRISLLAALKACASLAVKDKDSSKIASLTRGKAIHTDATNCGYDCDLYVGNSVIDMYAKSGSMVEAHKIFDRMKQRNVVTWTAMIMGYADNGNGDIALEFYSQLQHQSCISSDHVTFVAALKACCTLATKEEGKKNLEDCLKKGRSIHQQAVKSGFDSNIYVTTSLIDMYAKCGDIDEARRLFDTMAHPTTVSWSALIMGYAESGEGNTALQLYVSMQEYGYEPDEVTFLAALKACACLAAKEEAKQINGMPVKVGCLAKGRAIHTQVSQTGHDKNVYVKNALLDMYAKCGSMVDARRMFDSMKHHSVVSWTAIILGYAENGEGHTALKYYKHMQDKGCMPNRVTVFAVLKACGSLAALQVGKKILAQVSNEMADDSLIAKCVLDFYGKCGNMIEAQQVFESIASKDLVTWNALMVGYSRQGDANNVFDLFGMMEKQHVLPNRITFLAILTTCSHAGLVEKGKYYFEVMSRQYGVVPGVEHYTCMVDLLGRANELEEAVEMVKCVHCEEKLRLWVALLGASCKWTNVIIGRFAFESIVKLDNRMSAAYIMMAKIYASERMWEESKKITAMRISAKAWKRPGQSMWTDDTGIVHTFMAGDTRCHPQTEQIYTKLKEVEVKIKEEGYVPHLESVVDDISDTEKESALFGHSEKLAIACALINTSHGTAIRLVKNLRACDDCHNYIAFISKVEQRLVVCRDGNRFHTFEEGRCSCGNFW